MVGSPKRLIFPRSCLNGGGFFILFLLKNNFRISLRKYGK
jgi:hypothetical protein